MKFVIAAALAALSTIALALDTPRIELRFITATSPMGNVSRVIPLATNAEIKGYNIYVDDEYYETVVTEGFPNGGSFDYSVPDSWCSIYVTTFDFASNFSPRSNALTNNNCTSEPETPMMPAQPVSMNPPNLSTPETISVVVGSICVETIVRINFNEVGRNEVCY